MFEFNESENQVSDFTKDDSNDLLNKDNRWYHYY